MLSIILFFSWTTYPDSPEKSHALPSTKDLSHLHLQIIKLRSHLTARPSFPTRNSSGGGQAISNFALFVQKVGTFLPPQQQAILGVFSTAVALVASYVDDDEKYQQYKEFLRWQEQQKSPFFTAKKPDLTIDAAYAIQALTFFHEQIFTPQKSSIRAKLTLHLKDIEISQSSYDALALDTQSSATLDPKPNLEELFSEISNLFTQVIEILRALPQQNLF